MDRQQLRLECVRIAFAEGGDWRALALAIEEFVLAAPEPEMEGEPDEFFS